MNVHGPTLTPTGLPIESDTGSTGYYETIEFIDGPDCLESSQTLMPASLPASLEPGWYLPRIMFGPESGLNIPGATGMEDSGGKVRDNIASQIPDNYGYKDLARDIAYIIQNDYGSHNIKPFMEELSQKLQRPNY